MTQVIKNLSETLSQSFPQEKDLVLLTEFIDQYEKGGIDSVKEYLANLIQEIERGDS